MFFVVNGKDLAIAQIPKAGFSSISEWLKPVGFCFATNDKVRGITRRAAFIRHPIERLKSAYSFMHRLKSEGEELPAMAHTETWHDIVDAVLSGVRDDHWNRQVEGLEGAANEFRRFESLPECHREYVDAPFPHLNRSPRLPVDDYRAGELADYYADDLGVWKGAR